MATDLASLVLAVDSSQVKTGVAALDGLTAAGTRAQAATTGFGLGAKGAASAATAMAAEAQVASRAAVGLATSFGAASSAAHINTLAMRETLVVARELSRGNFSRIPGSLTLLAQGIGSQGGLGAFASAIGQKIGFIKTLQNAELAEAAAEAAAAAQSVRSAAERAGASIQAADTELALAQAQLRVAETSTAEVAAQARLAAAHEAVAVAAGEGAIAENAFAVAQGRATAAGEASAAATTTTLGATAAVLIGVGIAAVGAEAAFKAFQTSVDDTGALDRYAQSLVKTKDELKELEDKVGGFQVTWGDVMHGVAKAAKDALDLSSSWQKFKEDAANAFGSVLNSAEVGASYMYGVWSAAIDRLAPRLTYLAQLIGSVWHGGGAPDAPKGSATSFSDDVSKYANEARTKIRANMQTISRDIVGAAEDRISGGLGKPAKGRHPREAADHSIQNEKAYQDQVARLDGEILAAKEKLAGTAQEQATLAIQRIVVERDKTITDAKAQLARF